MQSKPLLGASEPVDAALYNLLGRATTSASTDAPANPVRGDAWLQTDTMQLLVYYGATSGWALPWNMPWGFITDTSQLSNGATSGTTLLAVGQTSSFTVLANRRIEITGNIVESFGDTLNDTFQWGLNIDGGASLRTFSLDITAAGRYVPPSFIRQVWTSTGGAHTARATAQRTVGAGTYTGRIYLTVHDLGPAGSAPAS